MYKRQQAYNSWRARGSAYARQRMTSVAEAFLSYCRSQGYPASIYLSTSLAGSFSGVDTKSLTDNSYEVWVAHYSNELSAYPEYNVDVYKRQAILAVESMRARGCVEIDEQQMRQGLMAARNMGRFEILNSDPYVVIDGAHNTHCLLYTSIIRGDATCYSIAAASIVAKVARDSYMREMDEKYPGYAFASNKGYGTAAHYEGLRSVGPVSYTHLDVYKRQVYSRTHPRA